MPSPYQDFVKKARERFEARQEKKKTGPYSFTRHARYKMQQYGLSEQRVRSVIRNPKRKEEGIVPKTAALMQPVSVKRVNGKETWKQEIWVMIVKSSQPKAGPPGAEKVKSKNLKNHNSKFLIHNSANPQIRIISAWRYPGVSPKRNPIPDEILQELVNESILEKE